MLLVVISLLEKATPRARAPRSPTSDDKIDKLCTCSR